MSNIVDFRCRISNNVKRAIYNCAKEMFSKKLISRLYNVINFLTDDEENTPKELEDKLAAITSINNFKLENS